MKKSSWATPYREKKFLDSHKRKIELLDSDLYKDKRETAIVVMLDLQDTLNGIDDDKAKIFMNQLHKIRIKYCANKVIINLSSHMHSYEPLIKYLEILHRNLKPNIILDDATYLCGYYNYESGLDDFRGFGYNTKKTEVFENKYFSQYKVLCHGLIDDSASTDYIKKFKDNRPVFIMRPSKTSKNELNRDNMMCYSTLTDGFDGVLECMDSYLATIKDIPAYDILRRQTEELIHLSAFEVRNLCISKNFDLVLRYVNEGKLDDDDYERVARELGWNLKKDDLSVDELVKIRKIIEALGNYLDKDNEYLLSLINLKKVTI